MKQLLFSFLVRLLRICISMTANKYNMGCQILSLQKRGIEKKECVFMRVLLASLCFMVVFCVNSWSIQKGDPALVGVWLCDEGSGKEILDSSGNDNNATGTFKWGEGKIDGGIEVSSGSVDVPTSDSVNSIVDEVTLAGWFRVDADSDTGIRRQNAYLLEDQSATETTPNAWAFGVWTPGVLVLWGKTEVKQKEWIHIAGTYDGKTMKLYLNGKLDAETPHTGSIQVPGDLLQLKYGSETYIGGMDEIVILNRAIDENEVKLLTKGWAESISVLGQDKMSLTWGKIKQIK